MFKKKDKKIYIVLITLILSFVFCGAVFWGLYEVGQRTAVRKVYNVSMEMSPEKRLLEPEIRIPLQESEPEFPLYFQWDERWGDEVYGDGTIALNGCGPTCLSMVITGLTGNDEFSPDLVAGFSDAMGYYEDGVGSNWLLMTEGASYFGVHGEIQFLSEQELIQTVKNHQPVICAMGPGDFTTTGHFIVVTDYKEGGFVLHDPNSSQNSEALWSYDRLLPQIRNMWVYEESK